MCSILLLLLCFPVQCFPFPIVLLCLSLALCCIPLPSSVLCASFVSPGRLLLCFPPCCVLLPSCVLLCTPPPPLCCLAVLSCNLPHMCCLVILYCLLTCVALLIPPPVLCPPYLVLPGRPVLRTFPYVPLPFNVLSLPLCCVVPVLCQCCLALTP